MYTAGFLLPARHRSWGTIESSVDMRRVTSTDPIRIDELRGLVPGRFRDGVDDPATRETIAALIAALVRR